MRRQADRAEAAVIGSGPNGLAAAIVLAQAGHSVLVHEADARPGGGARTDFTSHPGFRHDICSAIHPMAVASPFLRRLPLDAHGLEWIYPPAAVAHPLDDGTAVVLERSIAATAAQLGKDADDYVTLLKRFVSQWKKLLDDTLGPLRWPAHPLLLGSFAWHALRSVKSLTDKRFRSGRARALFAGLTGHAMIPLEARASAAIGLMMAITGHAVGWPLPRGGAGAITDALVDYLEQLGGQIRTSDLVQDFEQIDASGPILFDTSPATMLDICGERFNRTYTRRLERFRYGPGVFKLDYVLKQAIPWSAPGCRRAATVHVGGSFEEIAVSERAAWRQEHAKSPFVIVTQPSLFDPTRAPEGWHTAWAYCHVPNGSSTDMTQAIERQIERFAPGFRDCIEARRKTDCSALQAYNANYVGGDINAGAANLKQLVARPTSALSPYATSHRRIFLCSASTPPGGGVHGMCGYFAAQEALTFWS